MWIRVKIRKELPHYGAREWLEMTRGFDTLRIGDHSTRSSGRYPSNADESDCDAEHFWTVHPEDAQAIKPEWPQGFAVCEHMIEAD